MAVTNPYDFVTGNVIYVDGGRHLHEYTNGSHPH